MTLKYYIQEDQRHPKLKKRIYTSAKALELIELLFKIYKIRRIPVLLDPNHVGGAYDFSHLYDLRSGHIVLGTQTKSALNPLLIIHEFAHYLDHQRRLRGAHMLCDNAARPPRSVANQVSEILDRRWHDAGHQEIVDEIIKKLKNEAYIP